MNDAMGIEQNDGHKVSLHWGASQTATGAFLDSAQSSGSVSEIDLASRLP